MSTPKKTYTAIASTLGWPADHETDGEGLFLQPEEAEVLNTALTNNATAAADLVTANATIETMTTEIAGLKTAAETAATTAQTQANRITELEGEVAKLGGQSSGKGTKLAVAAEVETVTTETSVSLNDPEHPLNKYANRFIKKKKNDK